MHHMESSLHLRMFSGTPTESVWSSVSGMCWGTPAGQQVLSRALVFENVNLSVCFQRKGGGVGKASWPCLQDHNRWPTGHLRCVLLVPSSCYICFTLQLWLPGDCFLTVPHSRHHGYTIPIVGNRPYKHLQTQTDTSMKTLFKPEITTCTARHSKPTIRQSFISLAHSGNTGHCITAITSLLIFCNIQISHVM